MSAPSGEATSAEHPQDPAVEFLTALLPQDSQVRARAFTALLRSLTSQGGAA